MALPGGAAYTQVLAGSASPFYRFDVIAKTGDADIRGIGDGVSINDSGMVAFVGQLLNGTGLFVGDGSTAPININPGFSRNPDRLFTPAVQINNARKVVARDRVSGSPPLSYVRIWDALTPDAYTLIATGGKAEDPFDTVYTHPSMNNASQVVFSALDNVTDKLATPSAAGFHSVPLAAPLRPLVADTGSIVVRAANPSGMSIRQYSSDLTGEQTITCLSGTRCAHADFTQVGRSPGISDDGGIVVFAGQRGSNSSPAVFASIDDGSTTRALVPIAGEAWDGSHCSRAELGGDADPDPICFAAFGLDSRVAVAHQVLGMPGIISDTFVVAFIATPNAPAADGRFSALKGLWTVRVDVIEGVSGMEYHRQLPQLVAQVGGTIGDATLTDLAVYDPIANATAGAAIPPHTGSPGDHRVAFWAATTSGSMVARADHVTLIVNTDQPSVDGKTDSVDALLAPGGFGHDGKLSLPEAVLAVNHTGPGYVIGFALQPGTTIVLTDTLTLSAPDTAINGDLDGNGSPDIGVDATKLDGNGSPDIGVDATKDVTETLIITSAGNQIEGLAITGIVLDGGGAHHNRIVNSHIGVAIDGTTARPKNIDGIVIRNGAHDNTIADSLISGNAMDETKSGVRIDSGAYDNQVLGNRIGVDVSGNPLPNGNGITIAGGAYNNTIGGQRSAAQSEKCGAGTPCNVISSSHHNGIHLTGAQTHDNRVWGNFIGAQPQGLQSRPNEEHGILVDDGAKHNQIGHPDRVVIECSDRCNLIGGNDGAGIAIQGANDNFVEGNWIGVTTQTKPGGPPTTVPLRNGHSGVVIGDAAQGNRIGGKRNGVACDGPCNVIAGNDENGVLLEDAGTTSNSVLGNYIGIEPLDGTEEPNVESGVAIRKGAASNWIGDERDGIACDGRCNIISGNADAGVLLEDPDTAKNTVLGNYIGTDPTGTKEIINGTGVSIQQGAVDNTIGGARATGVSACQGPCNLISGNHRAGVALRGTQTISNTVAGNYLGISATGTITLPNEIGVLVELGARHNWIGKSRPSVVCDGPCNLISGNHQAGVVLKGSQTISNTVAGNYIGVNSNGAGPMPNEGPGVAVQTGASQNTIGGPRTGVACDGPCNLISGNTKAGVAIVAGGSRNQVQGNYIGLNAQGTGAIPNRRHGISVSSGTGELPDVLAAIALNAEWHQSDKWADLEQVDPSDVAPTVKLWLENHPSKSERDGLLNASKGFLFELLVNRTQGWKYKDSTPNQEGWDSKDDGKRLWQIKAYPEIGCAKVLTILSADEPVVGVDVWGLALPKGSVISGCSTDNTLKLAKRLEHKRILFVAASELDVREPIERFFEYALNLSNGATATSSEQAALNSIGGLRGGVACDGFCNVISGNGSLGVFFDVAAADNQVLGNYIGVNPEGLSAIPNGLGGVGIFNTGQTRIGGERATAACTGPCNLISGNHFDGVWIWGSGSAHNEVLGNYIGLNAAGAGSVPNRMFGVSVDQGATATRIGGARPSGLCSGQCNLISGNLASGVLLWGAGTNDNLIRGNFIGADSLGGIVANGRYGVAIGEGASFNIVGAEPGAPISGLCVAMCDSVG